jgi:hypothetical protein
MEDPVIARKVLFFLVQSTKIFVEHPKVLQEGAAHRNIKN